MIIGQTIANYQILEKLGEGGMGVVYKAQDVRLRRLLALKFIDPLRVTPERRQRFFQEARAASALNHPSITTIYDVGQWEGSDFIAMEYVTGETLDRILLRGPLKVDDALRYAIQVADAMAVAHAAHIIHRDLKPGNLMVTDRGLVKILDFGLARLEDRGVTAAQGTESSSGTHTLLAGAAHTLEGAIVGTPAYMSPEQITSVPVDARSDIFSFGLVLCEMLTARPAFAGKSQIEVLAAILQAEPPRPGSIVPGIPPELDFIVARCLRKDPARRFQSMAEVKAALEDLRTETQSGVRPPPAIPLPPPHRTRFLWPIGALILAAAVIVGYFIWRRPPDESLRQPLEITQLTPQGGLSIDPAISPDGKLLVFSSDRAGDGHLDLWIKQIGSENSVRLTHDSDDDVEASFSPDGTQIAFRSLRDGGAIYTIPTLGGDETKIADGGRRPRFSPDGRSMVYWKGLYTSLPLRAGDGHVFIVDLSTSVTREFQPDFAAAIDPVWSPDGKHILFVGLKDPQNYESMDWWIAPVSGGPATMCPVLTEENFFTPFAWVGDRVYVSGDWEAGDRLGQVRIDSGTLRPVSPPARLTSSANDENAPSVAAGRLVFSSVSENSDLYRLALESEPAGAAASPQRLTRDGGRQIPRSITPDGKRIVFTSDRAGTTQLWALDLDPPRERPLTSGGAFKAFAALSPDGRSVAWTADSASTHDLFITPFAGGLPVRVGTNATRPGVWSADSRFLIYTSAPNLRLLDVAAHRDTEYLKAPAGLILQTISLSNDGRWLAFIAGPTVRDFGIYVAPFAPGHPPARSEWVEVLRSPFAHPNAAWSADDRTIYFSSERDQHNCLWAQRLDPATKHPRGEPFAVRHFHDPAEVMIAPSLWRQLVAARNQAIVSLDAQSGGIWMLKLRQ